jgi:hypothetical protein
MHVATAPPGRARTDTSVQRARHVPAAAKSQRLCEDRYGSVIGDNTGRAFLNTSEEYVRRPNREITTWTSAGVCWSSEPDREERELNHPARAFSTSRRRTAARPLRPRADPWDGAAVHSGRRSVWPMGWIGCSTISASDVRFGLIRRLAADRFGPRGALRVSHFAERRFAYRH